MNDKSVSPVGWYLASYLLRFVELKDDRIDDEDARFVSWENTILVQAKNLEEAFDKAMRVARTAAKRYRGGCSGVPVQWKVVGITDVLPIYENLADGCEIAWAERAPRKLGNLKQMVRPKSAFRRWGDMTLNILLHRTICLRQMAVELRRYKSANGNAVADLRFASPAVSSNWAVLIVLAWMFMPSWHET